MVPSFFPKGHTAQVISALLCECLGYHSRVSYPSYAYTKEWTVPSIYPKSNDVCFETQKHNSNALILSKHQKMKLRLNLRMFSSPTKALIGFHKHAESFFPNSLKQIFKFHLLEFFTVKTTRNNTLNLIKTKEDWLKIQAELSLCVRYWHSNQQLQGS